MSPSISILLISKIKSSIYNYFFPFNVYRYVTLLAVIVYVFRITWIFFLAFKNNGFVEPDAPFGGDFLSFYAASKLALFGTPELVYDINAHWAVQKTLFGENIGYFAFFYPPVFLLYCFGFGLISYMSAVIFWNTIGLIFFLSIFKYIGGKKLSIITILAFGGVYISIITGQNSFFSAALIGAFALFVPKRPILAGVIIGLLAFKPHLGIIIPFVLIAAGMWRSFAAASVTVIILVLVSVAVFGVQTWFAFLANAPMAVFALEENHIGNDKMHSLFGAARMLGAPLWLAYGLQATTAIIAITTNIYLARRLRDPRDIAVVMACGTLIITPFILHYDLTILAIPLIWLFQKGQKEPLVLVERLVMMVAFILPMLANWFARELHIPLAPFIVISLFWLIVLRARRSLSFD